MRKLWKILCLLLAAAVAPLEGAEPNGSAINFFAEEQRVEGDLWRGIGNVKILYQDISIQCDEMEYNRVTQDLVARGGVVLDQGPTRFTADELHYNLDTKTGLFINGKGFMPPMYSFEGRQIEKIDETRFRIDDAIFTTCESDDANPPWSFRIRRALIKEEGLGRFSHSSLKIQKVPIFYLPYLVWPVKRERSLGLLMPGFGYSDNRGFYFGLPLYIPVGRSYDTTVVAHYYSDGYYGIGNEWRWRPKENAKGDVYLFSVWDPVSEEYQWKINGRHEQDDFLGFSLLAQVEDLSDIDFFQEFDRDFDNSTRRDLFSFVNMTRTWGPSTLTLRADHRKTFLTNQDVVLSRLPEAELRVRSTPIGNSSFYWNLISSLNYLDVDRGGDLVNDYGRADIFPTLAYTLPSPLWLSVTPRVGGRYTYYTARYSEDRTSFEDEAIDRWYLAGGVDIVGPSVSKVINKPLGPYSKFKHVIEPRIEYNYLDGTEDTSQIPPFDEVDSTRFVHRARLALANRLLARSKEGVSARELGSFELFQDYSLSDPLNESDTGSSQWGPLNALLRLAPIVGTGFDVRVSYDTFFKNLSSTSVAASLRRPVGMLNLTWYNNFSARTGKRISSQVRTIIGFNKRGFPFGARLQLAYDIERSELQQQALRLEWKGSCWGVSAQYTDLRLGQFPSRDFRIIISLRGIGALPEIRGSLGPVR
jgi:lipopolysaccharide assembly outer membrane protein LptD (OstA)